MRKTSLLIFAMMLCTVGVFAQDDLAQYQTWMKSAARANNALKKSIADSDAAGVTANATKAADSFDQIAKFWAGKHNDAAVKFAETARDAAKAVAGGDNAAAAKIGSTCGGCHAITRDGDKFKM